MRTVIRCDPTEVRRHLERELERMLGVLDARDDIEQVWCHGSLVVGEIHATSDVDLLVVQRTSADAVDRAVQLRGELAPAVPLDLVVVTPDELAAGGRFLRHVLEHGRRLR